MKMFSRLFVLAVLTGAYALVAAEPVLERRLPLAEYRDKMAAGWIGQMAGVSVGQPIEVKYNGPVAPLSAILRKQGDASQLWWPAMINEAFKQDDLYVEMTFLSTLSIYGLDVRPARCGIAFANSAYPLWYANRAGRTNLRRGIAPPDSGHPKFSKECNEIDYQIEADFTGLISPGCPDAVIALGEKFGRLMNYGDGVWAGQFIGGMYAEAYFTTNREQIVRAGLACIPPQSSYYKVVDFVLGRWLDGRTWEKAHERVVSLQYQGWMPELKDVFDCRLNGAFVVIGLLWGEGDPEKTIEIAARCGHDADCNASSAAGVVFTMLGRSKLDPKWYSAMDASSKFLHTPYTFGGVVSASEALALKVVTANGGRLDGDTLVIPVKTPVPAKYTPSWKPDPPTGARYSAAELAEIVYAPDGKRKVGHK